MDINLKQKKEIHMTTIAPAGLNQFNTSLNVTPSLMSNDSDITQTEAYKIGQIGLSMMQKFQGIFSNHTTARSARDCRSIGQKGTQQDCERILNSNNLKLMRGVKSECQRKIKELKDKRKQGDISNKECRAEIAKLLEESNRPDKNQNFMWTWIAGATSFVAGIFFGGLGATGASKCKSTKSLPSDGTPEAGTLLQDTKMDESPPDLPPLELRTLKKA